MKRRGWYAAGETWLHGGPEKLDGGRLRRWTQAAQDDGIFLCRERDKFCPVYASYYAQGPAGLYRVTVQLDPEQVYDRTNPAHRARLAPFARGWVVAERAAAPPSPREASPYPAWSGLRALELPLGRAGFLAVVVSERGRGRLFPGSPRLLSLAVFDQHAVRVIGRREPEDWPEGWDFQPFGRAALDDERQLSPRLPLVLRRLAVLLARQASGGRRPTEAQLARALAQAASRLQRGGVLLPGTRRLTARGLRLEARLRSAVAERRMPR